MCRPGECGGRRPGPPGRAPKGSVSVLPCLRIRLCPGPGPSPGPGAHGGCGWGGVHKSRWQAACWVGGGRRGRGLLGAEGQLLRCLPLPPPTSPGAPPSGHQPRARGGVGGETRDCIVKREHRWGPPDRLLPAPDRRRLGCGWGCGWRCGARGDGLCSLGSWSAIPGGSSGGAPVVGRASDPKTRPCLKAGAVGAAGDRTGHLCLSP